MPNKLSKEEYAKSKDWKEKFSNKVMLSKLPYNSSWKELFNELFEDVRIHKIEDELTKEIDKQIYPKPRVLFNAFRITTFEKFNDQSVSQAMGLSFSVPYGMKIPSSLCNIYKNLLNYHHIDKMPKHGNLENWGNQGCLMLNTSLSVIGGAENKNCHQNIWKWFTDKIIKYISDRKEHVIFVLWGSYAYEKIKLIDLDKHEVVISSHPSGLSSNKPMKSYPAFNNYDHFGEINKILKKWYMDEINWNL